MSDLFGMDDPELRRRLKRKAGLANPLPFLRLVLLICPAMAAASMVVDVLHLSVYARYGLFFATSSACVLLVNRWNRKTVRRAVALRLRELGRCPECGYDLGHVTGQRCPECGLPTDAANETAPCDGRAANATPRDADSKAC